MTEINTMSSEQLVWAYTESLARLYSTPMTQCFDSQELWKRVDLLRDELIARLERDHGVDPESDGFPS